MAALGMSGHVFLLLEKAILKCCSGPTTTAAPGMKGHVLKLLQMVILKLLSGRMNMDVLGQDTDVPTECELEQCTDVDPGPGHDWLSRE